MRLENICLPRTQQPLTHKVYRAINHQLLHLTFTQLMR